MGGWELVPLMCALEVPVKGSLEKCIRLMLHVNTDKTQQEIEHVYLGRAQALTTGFDKSIGNYLYNSEAFMTAPIEDQVDVDGS